MPWPKNNLLKLLYGFQDGTNGVQQNPKYFLVINIDKENVNLLNTTRDRRLRLKPALVQDTDYMVEKTYHLAPYLAIFGAYLTPQ